MLKLFGLRPRVHPSLPVANPKSIGLSIRRDRNAVTALDAPGRVAIAFCEQLGDAGFRKAQRSHP